MPINQVALLYVFDNVNIYQDTDYFTMKNILPIAIDLGAKNTGVFSGYYDKDTKVENLKHKQGNVYDLSKDAYSLLMTSRTTKLTVLYQTT